MSSHPEGAVVGRSRPAAPKKSAFWSCFSCRFIAGAGLTGAGLWVHLGVRKSLKRGMPAGTWDFLRLAFAIGLYSWAAVIFVDPVGEKIELGAFFINRG